MPKNGNQLEQASPLMERDEALAFLMARVNYERRPPDRPSRRTFELAPIRELLARLEHPEQKVPIVHVAGTKGKGSTAAMIAACLTAAGYKTGLSTSPHLHRVEERFVVGGAQCTADEFVSLVEAVRGAAEGMQHGERLTFFELTTAMAFLHFARSSAQAAVVEVGLGGRLDSTNVCLPVVSVITTISYDHTRLLGNTLAEIAREKAGIVKQGVPVVSGVLDPEPRGVIREICRLQIAELWELGTEFRGTYQFPTSLVAESLRGGVQLGGPVLPDSWCERPLELRLVGAHQATNAALAAGTLARLVQQGWSVPLEALQRGFAEVDWPARFEIMRKRPLVVIDGAHNVASATALLETLQSHTAPRRRYLVFATSRDKDPEAMLRILSPWFDQIVLTRFQNNPRGVSPDELAKTAVNAGCAVDQCTIAESPMAAWHWVRSRLQPEDLLCVAGSLFLAAEMREQLAADPVSDALAAAG